MMPKPCEITGCPELSEIESRWCAVHRAMSELERKDEELRRIIAPAIGTERIEYERKP